MILFLLALGILILSAFLSIAVLDRPRFSSLLGLGGAVCASLIGMVPVLSVLLGGEKILFRADWGLPFASFYLGVDKLSSLFLLLILLLSALSAVYGYSYLLFYKERKTLGVPWFFFNILVASMMLVVSARNAILFLVAWEVMSLSSFFLVTFEHEKENVRKAGWTYLVATHLGTAFLFVLFLLLGRESGSFDFENLSIGNHGMLFLPGGIAFLFAMIGFGTKAGFMPLHTWLPEAHPAAPSHVSALMSGVMIKMGIYGLIRVVTFLGVPEPWWGLLLIGVGLLSGILGILMASAQKELKSLLAYSSVENIGIISTALGMGYLALSLGYSGVAFLGLGGALLHVVNHALFKGMLFLGAGSILHGAKTGTLDRLGGLFKKMPWTGTFFLIGAWAISGLPPLNGFISEFLIYLGAFRLLLSGKDHAGIALFIMGGLALIGALACASFTKAFGIVFLGNSRTREAASAHEGGWAMRLPLLVLGSLCFLVSIFSPFLLRPLAGILEELTGLGENPAKDFTAGYQGPLVVISFTSLAVLGIILALSVFRSRLLSKKRVEQTVTWDCGYAAPTPRMQYTASSFLNLLSDLFKPVLWIRGGFNPPEGYFPKKSLFFKETLDLFQQGVFVPLFGWVRWVAGQLRWLQHGRTHLYVLYIAIVFLSLLVWNLR